MHVPPKDTVEVPEPLEVSADYAEAQQILADLTGIAAKAAIADEQIWGPRRDEWARRRQELRADDTHAVAEVIDRDGQVLAGLIGARA